MTNSLNATIDRPPSGPKVVFIDHVARLSGGEIALLRVLPTLARYVDVTAILGEDGPFADRLRDEGIPGRGYADNCETSRPT